MNEATLCTCPELEPLGIWMYQNGIEYMGDLVLWEDNQDEDWKNLPLPPELKPLYENLNTILRHNAPVSKTTPNTRGWDREGKYLVKPGYAILLSQNNSPPSRSI